MSEAQVIVKKRRPSLFGAVDKDGSVERETVAPQSAASERTTAAQSTVRGRQDRQDKRQVAGFFSPECAKQLRMLAAERDTTVQALLREGLNLMFKSHGKAPIA